METMTYSWKIIDCVAELEEWFQKPVRYNLCSLRATVQNIVDGRKAYATYEAWQKQLNKYQHGLALLEAAVTKTQTL